MDLPCGVDPSEFEVVFHRYGKPVLSFIYGLIGDRASAEELTQETFIRAFSNFRSLHERAKLSTWLFGIAHNVAREAIRQRYKDKHSVLIDGPNAPEIQDVRLSPDQNVIAREITRKIQGALASLSQDQRVVFLLKMIYRLHYEDISSITGASVGKLKTDLHRARLEMQRKLKPYVGERVSRIRGES